MKREFDLATQLLLTGTDTVSPHMVWLAKLITHKYGHNIVNQVHFDQDLPAGQFGIFYGPTKSICLNIQAHFTSQLATLQQEDNKFSLRALIIMEFINSLLHESFHANSKGESGNFAATETVEEEENAVDFADIHMWEIAKTLDTEITSFGTIIDEQLVTFYRSIRASCDGDSPKSWELVQLSMLDKGILFLDTKNEIILKSFFEISAYLAKDTTGWNRANVNPFNDDIADNLNILPEIAYFIHPESECAFTETEPVKINYIRRGGDGNVMEVDEATYRKKEKEYASNAFEKVSTPIKESTTSGPMTVPDGCDMSDPANCEIVNVQTPQEHETVEEEDIMKESSVSPEPVQETAPPVKTATNAAGLTGPEKIRAISEIVFRRLFYHIYTKCGPLNNGKFSNPQAVLDPVRIDDIQGAVGLFHTMDHNNALGQYSANQPVIDCLKGSISKSGLPIYRFHFKVGNTLYKRAFLPQNPEKTKGDGTPTAWANKVLNGDKLVMLLADGTAPKLYIELPKGQPLGQEKVTVWGNK